MSNYAITYRAPAGIPGAITREEISTVEDGILNASYPPLKFGIPMKLSSGLYLPVASGDSLASVMPNGGILVRRFPTQRSTNEALGTAVPDLTYTTICNILKRGYICVKVNASLPSTVPVKGGVVYVRKTDHGAGEYPIGGIESDADGAKCEALPGAYFTGAQDADGNCEIAYNI